MGKAWAIILAFISLSGALFSFDLLGVVASMEQLSVLLPYCDYNAVLTALGGFIVGALVTKIRGILKGRNLLKTVAKERRENSEKIKQCIKALEANTRQMNEMQSEILNKVALK